MKWTATPLWLWTLLGIAGFGLGLALHLFWHPLRRHLSEGLDALRHRRILLGWAGLGAIATTLWPRPDEVTSQIELPASWMQLLSWENGPLILLQRSAAEATLPLHQVNPPWPLALLIPAALILTLVTLLRRPYATGLKRRLCAADCWLFVGLCLSSCLWLGLEIHRPLGPEWLLAARDALRLAFEALWTAGFQVWAARLLILWRRPETETSDGEAARAWRDLQGRWRQIIALTAFNAAWMSLRLWIHLERLPWVELIILEMLLVFSPLPLFIALNSAETAFRTSGGQTLSLLGRALPSLLGLLVTAIALMALLLQTQVSLRPMLVAAGLPPTAAALPFAFMLAIARNWLFLAAGLTFMAHLPGAPTTD